MVYHYTSLCRYTRPMKHCACVFCLLLSLTCYSQHDSTTAVTIGPEFKTDQNAVPLRVVHTDKSGFYVIFGGRANGKGPQYLYKFDHALGLVAHQKQALDLDVQQRKIEYRLVPTSTGLYYISFLPNQRLSQQYFIQQVDPNTLELSQPRMVPMTKDFSRQPPLDYTFLNSTYGGKRVALAHKFETNVNSYTNVAVNVFDQDMQSVWDGAFQLPVIDKLLYLRDYQVDEQGIVHILAKRYYKNIREVRDKVVNYDYLLFSLHPDGSIDSQEIKTENKLLSNIRLGIAANGDITCVGTYSQGHVSGLGGVFYARWEAQSGKKLISTFTPLSEQFFTAGMSDNEIDKMRKVVAKGNVLEHVAFAFRTGTSRSDGGYTLLGSVYQLDPLDFTAKIPGNKVYMTGLNDGESLVIHVNGEGVITYSRVVVNSVFEGSTCFLLAPNELVTFYAQNKKTRELISSGRLGFPLKISENTVVHALRFGAQGEQETIELYDWASANSKTSFDFSLRLNSKEMLLLGRRKPYQRFIKVSFKNPREQ